MTLAAGEERRPDAWPRLDGARIWLVVAVAAAALAFEESDMFARAIWQVAAAATAREATEGLFALEQATFSIPLFLLAIAFFRRRIGAGELAVACALAWVSESELWFYDHLHGAILWAGLYPAWFERDEVPGFVNPQVARVLLLLALVAAFGAAFAFSRRFRSFDRLFVLISTLSVISTTVLFHLVLVEGTFATARANARAGVEAALTAPGGEFPRLCSVLALECWEGPRGVRPDIPAAAATLDVLTGMEAGLGGRPDAWWSDWRSINSDGRVPFNVVLGVRRIEDRWRAVADIRGVDAISVDQHWYFSVLALSARSVWIFGFFGLLAFHRQRFARRG